MMTTEESPRVRALWELIHKYVPKAEFGGSVPNLATEQNHSYHRSFDDSPHDGGYSVHYYGDRHPWPNRHQYASALDVTLPTAELMTTYTARLHRLAVTNPSSHWDFGLREFAGTLDGSTVFGFDSTRNVRTFGWDNSHLWHIHISINRRFVTAARIMRIADAFKP